MGWYMVKSGMVDRPDVSQYRLTAHLGLAVVIYGYMFWVALSLLAARKGLAPPPLRRWGLIATVLVSVTLLSGGLVAGLDAGFTYNTFPLMDGRIVPAGYWAVGGISVFEDIDTVQFNHRWLAKLTLAAIVALWFHARRFDMAPRAQMAVNCLLAVGVAQLALGIATLLTVVSVPLAALHQAGAMVLFTAALWLVWELWPAKPTN